MTAQQEKLHRFFTEKAKHLQNEIDLEIANIGGEDMLISREDLIHWVYHSRREIEMYHTICRMLEDKAEDADADIIRQKLRDTMLTDEVDIEKIRKKQEEERKALQQLREEAENYRLALEVLEG